MMETKRLKVIVAGASFGRFYCEALRQLGDRFELCGVLSRGSEASRRCAADYGVRLFQDTGELDDGVDLACVVVRSSVLGGDGTQLAMDLLARGIHVMQEQPVHYKDIQMCLKAARTRGLVYRLGDLYKYLPPARHFIAAARHVFKNSPPLYIDAGLATQVTYPFFDILSAALGPLKPYAIRSVVRDSGPFHVMTADLGGVPAVLQVHNEIHPDEPDNYMHYLHRLTIGTASGRLCLADVFGSVTWYNRVHFPMDTDADGLFAGRTAGALQRPCERVVYEPPRRRYGDVFRSDWLAAIAADIRRTGALITAPPSRVSADAAGQLACSKLWHDATDALGYPVLIRPERFSSTDMGDLAILDGLDAESDW